MYSPMKFSRRFWSDFTLSLNSNCMMTLSPRECGRPLFEKVRHAFLEVLALQALDHLLFSRFERFAERLEHAVINLFLDYAHRPRAHASGQFLRVRINAFHELVLREHLVHHAHAP